jgi:osmotically inducible protein OsmC
MPIQKAEAVWNGSLKTGNGKMKPRSGICEVDFSFASRFMNGDLTNPEELIGAAHAGCYSMALSKELAEAGYEPRSVKTTAEVTFEVTGGGPAITGITLKTKAAVSDIDDEAFQKLAQNVKEGCPVSRALASTSIELIAALT